MRFGFVFPGDDPRAAAQAAHDAEAAGWDGFFVADAVWWADPWVTLAAVAMSTERIRMGPMLTPVSRRRPWKLAAETATLDNLSGGRVILTVGLGATDTGFAEFGEQTDRRVRAELLDEGLDIVTGLWLGQPFSYDGRHYTVRPLSFPPPPPPVQQPRIPVWVVGAWPRERSMARAARYDGVVPAPLDASGGFRPATPADVGEIRAWVDARRDPTTAFDVVVDGLTPDDAPRAAAEVVAPLAAAGATWWLEAPWTDPDPASVRRRIRRGPPRAS